ncbi:hypothetical protein [Aminivibrio sp.]|nr:hypothetical protein [Aminivibrio sp.]
MLPRGAGEAACGEGKEKELLQLPAKEMGKRFGSPMEMDIGEF